MKCDEEGQDTFKKDGIKAFFLGFNFLCIEGPRAIFALEMNPPCVVTLKQ